MHILTLNHGVIKNENLKSASAYPKNELFFLVILLEAALRED